MFFFSRNSNPYSFLIEKIVSQFNRKNISKIKIINNDLLIFYKNSNLYVKIKDFIIVKDIDKKDFGVELLKTRVKEKTSDTYNNLKKGYFNFDSLFFGLIIYIIILITFSILSKNNPNFLFIRDILIILFLYFIFYLIGFLNKNLGFLIMFASTFTLGAIFGGIFGWLILILLIFFVLIIAWNKDRGKSINGYILRYCTYPFFFSLLLLDYLAKKIIDIIKSIILFFLKKISYSSYREYNKNRIRKELNSLILDNINIEEGGKSINFNILKETNLDVINIYYTDNNKEIEIPKDYIVDLKEEILISLLKEFKIINNYIDIKDELNLEIDVFKKELQNILKDKGNIEQNISNKYDKIISELEEEYKRYIELNKEKDKANRILRKVLNLKEEKDISKIIKSIEKIDLLNIKLKKHNNILKKLDTQLKKIELTEKRISKKIKDSNVISIIKKTLIKIKIFIYIHTKILKDLSLYSKQKINHIYENIKNSQSSLTKYEEEIKETIKKEKNKVINNINLEIKNINKILEQLNDVKHNLKTLKE